MSYENRSFPEAVEALADMLDLEVPRTGPTETRSGRERRPACAAARGRSDLPQARSATIQTRSSYLKRRGIDGQHAGALRDRVCARCVGHARCARSGRRKRGLKSSSAGRPRQRERQRSTLRSVPRSNHVSDPQWPRPSNWLRWTRARLGRAQVSELTGDTGVPQRPRALRTIRGTTSARDGPRRSSSSRATGRREPASSTASRMSSRRSARQRRPRI